ncbi:MAG: LptF/LptG family permease, partial [Kiloniellaceae bacterium]|nr:LptF/LptG family permease [Kiloniellaceae bacterium]
TRQPPSKRDRIILWTAVPVGLALFLIGQIGASTGIVALPFDPHHLFTQIAGGVLFLLEESVLGPSNRRAEAIRHVMRGGSPQTFDVVNRRWMVGSDGEIYHYNYFDPRQRQLSAVSIYDFDAAMSRLERRVYAERAIYVGARGGAPVDAWHVEQGWTREFDDQGETSAFSTFAESQVAIEPAAYFATQPPD